MTSIQSLHPVHFSAQRCADDSVPPGVRTIRKGEGSHARRVEINKRTLKQAERDDRYSPNATLVDIDKSTGEQVWTAAVYDRRGGGKFIPIKKGPSGILLLEGDPPPMHVIIPSEEEAAAVAVAEPPPKQLILPKPVDIFSPKTPEKIIDMDQEDSAFDMQLLRDFDAKRADLKAKRRPVKAAKKRRPVMNNQQLLGAKLPVNFDDAALNQQLLIAFDRKRADLKSSTKPTHKWNA